MIELNLNPLQILSYAIELGRPLFLIVGAIIVYKKFQGA